MLPQSAVESSRQASKIGCTEDGQKLISTCEQNEQLRRALCLSLYH